MTAAPSRIEHGIRHLAKLETRECTPWFEDAMGLFQHCRNRRAIPNAKCDGVQIVCV